MQAITIAIGKNGINFFSKELVAKEFITVLSGIQLRDKPIQVNDFNIPPEDSVENLMINLTQGRLENFAPAFQNVSQQGGGNFLLDLAASRFNANYNWRETYTRKTFHGNPGLGGQETSEDKDGQFTYKPDFGQLVVNVPLQFTYNKQNQEWEVTATGNSTGTTTGASANVPSDSILQREDQECFNSHVSDTTSSAVSSIDFSSLISQLIKGMIEKIPDSGNLGNGIVYDFSLGDDGLIFPGNDGIQMGVKGGASYNGNAYPADAATKLPLPVPPSDSDSHHLCMYVSNYEIDALYWAYYKADKLERTVTVDDLDIIGDAGVLKVNTYIEDEPALEPYADCNMHAKVFPIAAPVTTFQQVWTFTPEALDILKPQVPEKIFQILTGFKEDNYTSKSNLEQHLSKRKIDSLYFDEIEKATQAMAMVVTSNLQFELVIEDSDSVFPNIVFSVRRNDILTKLQLGIGDNNAQTLKYNYLKAEFDVSFISTTVPDLEGGKAFKGVWRKAGEGAYGHVMSTMGSNGAPLPIMQDFQFDFNSAEISVQDGYVSILANVLFKNGSYPSDLKYWIPPDDTPVFKSYEDIKKKLAS